MLLDIVDQANITFLEKLATSSGALLYIISLLMNSLALTLTIEDTFQNLQNLQKLAKEDLGKRFSFNKIPNRLPKKKLI